MFNIVMELSQQMKIFAVCVLLCEKDNFSLSDSDIKGFRLYKKFVGIF